MPREPQFDRGEVLDSATNVFWQNGYEASSIQMLLDAMGINRGSLYASFGDKASLFKSSVANYSERVDQLLAQTLLSIPNPLTAVRSFMYEALLYNDYAASRHGCLLCNTVSELADTDPDLAESSRRQIEKIQNALIERIAEAKQQQLLAESVDAQRYGALLIAVIAGLRLYYKTGMSQSMLKTLIDDQLEVLGF